MRVGRARLIIVCCFWAGPFFYYQELQGQPQEIYNKKVSVAIEHGNGRNQIGFRQASQDGEREPVGPESFHVDDRGHTYICDGVNQGIQVFDSDGRYQQSVNLLSGTMASDVIVDESGNMYVYDDVQGNLSQYDSSGKWLTMIPVDISQWQSRGPMHLIKDTIYMRTSDQEDVPIGQLVNGLLEAPLSDLLSKPLSKGIHGQSGRTFVVKKTGQDEGYVEVADATDAVMLSFSVKAKNLASIVFLQEDDQGNIYIQTERFVPPDKIFLDVHKFTPQGKFVGHLPVPDNNYGAWSVKLLAVSNKGDIHQFLSTRERSYLNIFQRDN